MGAEAKPLGPSSFMKIFYIFLNVFSAVSIVFANKLVLSTYHFHFVTTLTLIHTLFTWAGMVLLARSGFFAAKPLAAAAVAPLALGYVGYIILNNLSLQLNTVGFYQILKIAIAPTVMLLDFVLFRKMQTWRIMSSVAVVCVGVTAATVTDHVAISNVVGLGVGLASVVVTALYQIWAGSKQKELQANSSQLLLAYTPQAILLLSVMVPLLDDLGLAPPPPGAGRAANTVLGYPYDLASVSAIVVSALLGILVSLSTFLVIGATSSLTYNIVGHFKTILILAGGCLLFGEAMPWKRLAGIGLTMCGIAWYTYLSIVQVAPAGGAHREPEILRDRSGHTRGGGGEREPLLVGGGDGPGLGSGGVGSVLGGSRV
ncbi:hypothetical protein HXX76_015207 [Chlamydomonas incerta]|uniref:Sugar phosphate transporter domain-containing protein n=1 Tax=Chlamydomonas incerta TaxID=51695 RepID=A0A835VNP7_CHLIN|nr:hypothetical protein HXX76_015207 [Chlamydomonas incerta]|eukprot:KAG2423567.1 hypothetical protein HXX76_015207 [Chlamydomonas incerta]